MFDALLGKKFTVKCKHAIKCISERLKPIRNRKQAVVNILKKDVAELLRNGGESHAYNRMDELLVEVNRLACYDVIDNFCQRIYKQLPLLQKQRECPPEDMEPVATLIFAAARISDLPELCNLRAAFMTHYGNPMEGFVNPEFKEKVAAKNFPQVKKIQLMEDIACEFNVAWNPVSFNPKNAGASGRSRPVKENPPKKEAAMANLEGEPVKKTVNKVGPMEPGNLTPHTEKSTEEVRQKKPDVKRREAQPFKSREEITDQPKPNVVLGAQLISPRSMRGAIAKEECENIVYQQKPDDVSRPVVHRESTRACARVNAVGEDRERKSRYATVDQKSTRENAIKEGCNIILEEPKPDEDIVAQAANRRSAMSNATKKEKEEIPGLGPQMVNQRSTKEKSIHAIPPPYVKSVGPKPELPGRVVEEVNEERPKSVRRKSSRDERRPLHPNKEDDVDQLLIYYSKKRIPEQKSQERVRNPPNRREADQLADRFSRLNGNDC